MATMTAHSVRKAFQEGVLGLSDGSKVTSLYEYNRKGTEPYFSVGLEGCPPHIERVVSVSEFRYMVHVAVSSLEFGKTRTESLRVMSFEAALIELIEYAAKMRETCEVYIRLDSFGLLVNAHQDWDVSGLFQIDFGGKWGSDFDSLYAQAREILVTPDWYMQRNGNRVTCNLAR